MAIYFSSFYAWVTIILIVLNSMNIAGAQSFLNKGAAAESMSRYGDAHTVGEPLKPLDNPAEQVPFFRIENYPSDPTADIAWSCGVSNVDDIECAFNLARNVENTQLGTTLPMVSLPDQVTWKKKSDGEKALFLINLERTDRGLEPLHGLETNVTSVAQYYAQYLMDNNAFDHYEDGRSPWQRLHDNPSIGDCYDFLAIAENLAIFWTSGSNIPIPVERSIYLWMYDDSGSSWGHRHAILWYPYNDNSGSTGKEGFLGIGRANGPHDGWNYSELVVMNVFDPCSTWDYRIPVADFTGTPTSGAPSLTVSFSDTSTGSVTAWSWDFGDLSTSIEQNPDHIYSTPGAFTVVLTVIGPEGSDTKTRSNYINVLSANNNEMPWMRLLLDDE
jgi:hypothetical protein